MKHSLEHGVVCAIAVLAICSFASEDNQPQPPAKPTFAEPMPEVVVTATRSAAKPSDVPASVTVIKADRIERPGTGNVREALADVPGVKINNRTGDGIFEGGLEVRGLSSNDTSGGNVLIMVDGIPQRRLSFGGPYMGALPNDAVMRMELVKGPSASLYGRGALAGALQLFTEPGTEKLHGKVTARYDGTPEAGRCAAMLTGPLPIKKGATFSLTSSGGAGDGWQPRTSGQRGDAYFHAEIPATDCDQVRLIAGVFSGFENIPAPVLIDKSGRRLPCFDRDTNIAVPNHNSLEMQEYRAGIVWKHEFDETFDFRLTTAYWNAQTTWQTGRPSDAPAKGTIAARPTDTRAWGEDSEYNEFQVRKAFNLSSDVHGVVLAGGNFEHFTWDNRMRQVRIASSTFAQGVPIDYANPVEPSPGGYIVGPSTERNTEEFDYGGFLRTDFSFYRRLDVYAGARIDRYRRIQDNLTSGVSADASDGAISPSTGALVHTYRDNKTDVGVYANWGKGFNPVFRAVGNTEIAKVSPETSESTEVGVKSSAGKRLFESTFAAYRLERNDVVAYNSAPDVAAYQNAGDWRIEGLEIAATGRPCKGLSLFGAYTIRKPEIANDRTALTTVGNDIPFISRQLATLGFEYQHTSGWYGGMDSHFVSKSFVDAANTIRAPAYTLLEAHVGYRWKQLDVSVYGKNLLDEEYYSGIFQGIKYGAAFEGTPRSVGAQVSFRW